jgi:hypothetical protein
VLGTPDQNPESYSTIKKLHFYSAYINISETMDFIFPAFILANILP